MSKKAPPPNFLYRVKVYSNEHPPWSKFCVASAPINGMPHLAYLGSMLEKRRGGGGGGNLPSKSSPWDWYSVGIVPIHSSDIHIFFLNVFRKFFVNSANTHVSLSHTAHDREICKGCVGGWYTGLCPGQVWGYVNSPPIPHQAPGVVCRAYH